MSHALVIGAGPAGLMAADVLATQGHDVTLCDAKPSVGRKFLMAGKSGLNLTMDAPVEQLLRAYEEAAPVLEPMLRAFDAQAVQHWAESLGQPVFTGSTGRVFPRAMKASPLLRAWLARLEKHGVSLRLRMKWQGWHKEAAVFETASGSEEIAADVTVLALGGASWARLGSDGAWTEILANQRVPLSPFYPANVGLQCVWSPHMTRHLGAALKGVRWSAGRYHSRGEAVLSARGLEGSGIYTISRGIREGAPLVVDLVPDLNKQDCAAKLSNRRSKASMSSHLRRTLKLDPAKIALAQEVARPLPFAPEDLARTLKNLTLPVSNLRPLDEAISVAGGVSFKALDDNLMLHNCPGVFCAGEMLDWEAPTGGYLLTACFATGRWAGLGALRYLENAA